MKLFYAMSILMLLCSCSHDNAKLDRDPHLEKMASSLLGSDVRTLELIYVPDTTSFRLPLTPDLLQTNYRCKVTLDASTYSSVLLRLKESLSATHSSPVSKVAEVRSGIVLRSNPDTLVSSIYFDRSGKLAMVDGISLQLEGPLYSTARELMRSCAADQN